MAKYMIIDGNRVEFNDEPNILALVRKAGIDLPTFCYYSDLSIYGACRMCVVEDQWGGIIASCSTPPKDKMEVKTNTPKLHQHRKMILELLLAAHCRDCTVCDKNGKCRLQELAHRFGIKSVRFENKTEEMELDTSSASIIRDPGKCILCGDCVRMCNEIQNVGAIDFAHRGAKMIVSPAFNKKIAETNCVNCGQCAAVCPTAAITVKSDLKDVWKAIYNPKKRVVVQVAPAVRVALGEEFHMKAGENVIGKIVAALRRLGFDAIFDTSVGADLTIMEESKELLKKLEAGENKYPLFTSCCPGWIRYAETKHKELLPYISTCKSPMEMFGAVIKEHFKGLDSTEGVETVSVAIMPCSAKKYEASREEFKRNDIPDVDYVITTIELVKMIKEIGIQFEEIEPEAPDMPFSLYSGAGVIFGVTGGVTEAAVRRVVADKSPKALKDIEFLGLRGMEGVKVCELQVEENSIVRIGVVSGLANAEALIEKIESGEEHFDFVEVMACPGGCIAGAGQPFSHKEEKNARALGMYKADKVSQIKRCEENPLMLSLYNGMLKHRTHELLHVSYRKED
ncbi:[FeFe] hydrogenase, group A [Lachnoclostridium phytofermentans]|uniref:Hydrogenase, Fe-only n=1 Tax=Lachnoclostridium phytofermentans (strain ATCC 700394 / DSM 18823 / ISDg) TaxID=357809 RepID=A9KQG8_LACP7|nr:[FeFe] hydrogenase, group A [Lachnoclostridium phytofermentans]ABX40477.1 hydrogenase, Fe-only [Lachnoclostridium phytofermentans ISDg]